MKWLLKYPKYFTVFGLKIRMKVAMLGDSVAGFYEPAKKSITMNGDHINELEFQHTLVHELGHALFYRVSINQAISREVHEYIVNNMATMLLENFELKPKMKL